MSTPFRIAILALPLLLSQPRATTTQATATQSYSAQRAGDVVQLTDRNTDTVVSILPSALFANGWLTAKLVLLVGYVGLGTFALKRGRTPRVRTACYLLALATYASMFTIARTHHPLGWLWTWLG